MKRRWAFILAALLLFAAVQALAEADTAPTGFLEGFKDWFFPDEPPVQDPPPPGAIGDVVRLRTLIDQAIRENVDWQEVDVPYGVYVVGEDIPAGHWTIRPSEAGALQVGWGDMLGASGRTLDSRGKLFVTEVLLSQSNQNYTPGDLFEVDFNLQEGQFVMINGIATFTPYAGKQLFDFQ